MNARVPTVAIDAADAYELVELLQLINDWLRADYHRHRASLNDLVGYDLDALIGAGHLEGRPGARRT